MHKLTNKQIKAIEEISRCKLEKEHSAEGLYYSFANNTYILQIDFRPLGGIWRKYKHTGAQVPIPISSLKPLADILEGKDA